MGLEIIVALIAFIVFMGLIFAYLYSKNQLFPPYQEPVAKCPFGFGNTAKEDVDPNWPFPTGRRP